MAKRILIGAILIALVCLVLAADWKLQEARVPRFRLAPDREVVLDGAPLTVVVILLIAAGYLELARLCAGAGLTVFRLAGLPASILIGSLPFWRQAMDPASAGAVLPVVLALTLMALFAAQLRRRRTDGAIGNVASSVLAVAYVGVCAGVALDIRIRFGLGAFVLFVAVVKATDIGAYFVGSAAGRHKMIPWLSPGKSWEGLAGGLVTAAAVGAALAAGLNALPGGGAHVELGPAGGAAFGAVTGLFGQVGDLCESALKRAAGAKDSAAMLPEFGGVLDIVDSPLLAAPVAYVLLAAAG
ncbi:MAG TPA: phosphatidate cytidylyltransferase [Phycisphaerae bacterium]|nr:phosphatidate cytidylyltransferase [Phycisphaerae bacterium]